MRVKFGVTKGLDRISKKHKKMIFHAYADTPNVTIFFLIFGVLGVIADLIIHAIFVGGL